MVKINCKKWFLYSTVILLLLFGSARLYYRLTDDFRQSNITEEYAYRPEWDVAPLSSEASSRLQTILKQPFFYIGKGAQSYVFGSENGEYVIKFFKFKHLRPTPFLHLLPSWSPSEPYRLRQAARKKRKFESVFSGYHLAYSVHRNESGLIFIHLNRTRGEFPIVTVYDKIGRSHQIPLDDVAFIVQRKGETLRTVLQKLLNENSIDIAKLKLNQIFNLYASEYRKGIYDHDHGVMQNAGFIGDEPIHLDVGKFKKEEKMLSKPYYSDDLGLVGAKIGYWLSKNQPKHYPVLAAHIESTIEAIILEPYHLEAAIRDIGKAKH